MAVSNFIPEVWSASLLSSLMKNTVMASVCNRDYEGQIRAAGDTVRITSIGRPTVADYTPGITTINPEALTDAQRALVIEKAKYFAFELDDVEAAQAASGGSLLTEAMQEASYALADVADQYLWGLYTDAAAANKLGTVQVNTADLAFTQLRKLALKLDEANVPSEGRSVVAPPWYLSLLTESTKFTSVDFVNKGVVENGAGFIGRAFGMNVYQSNNSVNVTGDDYAVIALHRSAITFAEQIVKVEAFRPDNAFSDAVKGLHVYGAKVVRPDAMATVVASIT